ncbi:MAG: hypothetical protein GY863_06205 [bacterium]|nr:hypothetical protein [bacterium]
MEKLSQLQVLLSGFSNYQKETLAELASEDLLLMDVWRNQINNCIREEEWNPDWLFSVIKDRIGEIIEELDNSGIENQLTII